MKLCLFFKKSNYTNKKSYNREISKFNFLGNWYLNEKKKYIFTYLLIFVYKII